MNGSQVNPATGSPSCSRPSSIAAIGDPAARVNVPTIGSRIQTHGESRSAPPNSSPCTGIPVADTSASTTWRSMARSTLVAKSSPRLLTAECARWPATKGFAATSRIADASATSSSRSIAALSRHRCQRLRQSKSSGVERLADDRTLHAAAGQRRDGTQIVEARHTTGGDHRNIGALGDGAQQVEIGSGQGAVFGDIGDDETRTAFAVKAFQHFPQVAAVGLPAAPPQPVITVDDLHVQTYRDFVAVIGDRLGTPRRVFQRGRPEIDSGTAGRERGRQRRVVANTAGQFDIDIKL